MDIRGIKDHPDVARFTTGVRVDNTGNAKNISIRAFIARRAGYHGIYIDDTPINDP